MLYINENISIADEYLAFNFVRSSGPGGQNVNKVNSCAQLRFDLAGCGDISNAVRQRLLGIASRYLVGNGELLIESQQSRSQHQNRQICLDRLRAMILQALIVPKKRRATKPTKAAKQRRLDAKKRRSAIKQNRSGKIDY
ncbi:MAG: aminoacyl-tRNA hydrolase [Phycisphaerae bacterium]|nr:aminoacyl-tRNA hydrolase [Phycisphaerae bacterium]